jgi:hypothetical protein
MSFFLFSCWIIANTLLVNIALKAGWDFDPGYTGPAIIVFLLNINLALYASKTNGKS